MSDPFFTARRVRIGVRILGFLTVFWSVIGLLLDLVASVFGPREFFGDFLPLDLLLGGVGVAAGAFLILRASDLARWLAEDHEA